MPAGIQNPNIIGDLPNQLEASNCLSQTFRPRHEIPRRVVQETLLKCHSGQLGDWSTIERLTARSPAEAATDFQLSAASKLAGCLLISINSSMCLPQALFPSEKHP